MKIKMLLIFLLIIAVLISGCMRPIDIKCNYDGVCDDWETDDCVDCKDVLGRGVPIPQTNNSDYFVKT